MTHLYSRLRLIFTRAQLYSPTRKVRVVNWVARRNEREEGQCVGDRERVWCWMEEEQDEDRLDRTGDSRTDKRKSEMRKTGRSTVQLLSRWTPGWAPNKLRKEIRKEGVDYDHATMLHMPCKSRDGSRTGWLEEGGKGDEGLLHGVNTDDAMSVSNWRGRRGQTRYTAQYNTEKQRETETHALGRAMLPLKHA